MCRIAKIITLAMEQEESTGLSQMTRQLALISEGEEVCNDIPLFYEKELLDEPRIVGDPDDMFGDKGLVMVYHKEPPKNAEAEILTKEMLEQKFHSADFMNKLFCSVQSFVFIQNNLEMFPIAKRVRDHFKNLETLASGSFGETYKASFQSIQDSVVIKTSKFGKEESQTALVHEYFVGLKVANKMREKVPNFAQVLGFFRCSVPRINIDNITVNSWCYVRSQEEIPENAMGLVGDYIIYEKIPGKTLQDTLYSSPQPPFSDVVNWIMQIIFALYIADRDHQFTHFDLHFGNIMMRDIPDKENTWVLYELEEDFSVWLRCSSIATMIDYGFSSCTYENIEYNKERSSSSNRGFLQGSRPLYDVWILLSNTLRWCIKRKQEADAFLIYTLMHVIRYRLVNKYYGQNLNKLSKSELKGEFRRWKSLSEEQLRKTQFGVYLSFYELEGEQDLAFDVVLQDALNVFGNYLLTTMSVTKPLNITFYEG